MNINSRVSSEAIYAELGNELRRYRDYELNIAGWYTTILLAILAFSINEIIKCDVFFGKYRIIQCFVVIVSILVWFSSCYSVWYVHQRYKKIRDITTEYLEPVWKIIAYQEIVDQRKMPPRCLIYLTQTVITLAILATVLLPFHYNGCT